MFRHLPWRAANKVDDSVVAQVQLPGAPKIEDSGERNHACDPRFPSGQTERELRTGGVPDHRDALRVDAQFVRMLNHVCECAPYIVERARPSAARISHPPVLDVRRHEMSACDRRAEMSRVAEVVLRAPVTPVYVEQHRRRTIAGREAHVREMLWRL